MIAANQIKFLAALYGPKDVPALGAERGLDASLQATKSPLAGGLVEDLHMTIKSVHDLPEGRQLITPELARLILSEANFSGQRPAAAHHIKLLSHIMIDGRWSGGGQLAFCRLDGRLHLTNGQHRMHAVIESGCAQEFQVLITPCASMAEVEADYHRHDVVARKRSVAEIMRSTTIAQESGLPKAMLSQLYSAASLLSNDLNFVQYASDPIRSRDTDYRLAIVAEWMPEARLFESFIRSAPGSVRSKLINAGVMAVALVTIRYQPAKAASFWRGIANDDGLRRGDPRKTLLNDFFARNTSTGTARQRVIPAINAWNAFYAGRDLKIIKVLDSSVIAVSGTPITGKAVKS